MRFRKCVLSVVVCICSFTASLWAVVPTKEEMADAVTWVSAMMKDGLPERAFFSFVYDGVASAELLNKWKVDLTIKALDAQRTQQTLTYADPKTGLVVRIVATEFKDFPAIEWVMQLENTGGQNTPIIEKILPLNMQWAVGKSEQLVLHHSLGESNSADSFAPVEQPLRPDSILTFFPHGGRSSDTQMPFFNLQGKDKGLLSAIGWSGQWEASFARKGDGQLQIRAGMQLTRLRLYPGEVIRTPRILLLFWRGKEDLRGNNLFRQLLFAHYLPRRSGEIVYAPICASVNDVDADGSYEGPHVRVMPALAERGFEVFWSDMDPQHWYPIGFPKGTGTWEPDLTKYPNGLKPIGEAAHAAGLQYLLWFEPERVAPGTRIDCLHPEWVTVRKEKDSRLFKLHIPEARAWLTDHIDKQISLAQLDWLRWDFNMEPLEYWRLNDDPDRQGMTEIGHITGLYAMWDELRARHPGLVIDNCASGGRRIDLETMMRGLPLWHSDMQCFGPNPAGEQLQNAGLFRWVPLHGCGNFGYEPSYAFRSAMTSGNIIATNSTERIEREHQQREAENLQKLGVTMDPWYTIGPFVAEGTSPFSHAFAPEIKVDLRQAFRDELLSWMQMPDWEDGFIHYFASKDFSANYTYRVITAASPVTLPIYLGSDDGIALWLNEKSVLAKDVNHAVGYDQEIAQLPLLQGENRLLLKVTNGRKETGFYFSTVPADRNRGCLDTAIPETEQECKRTVAIYKKVRPYMLGDFYPLFPHDKSEEAWFGYQFHRPDLHSGMAVLFRRAKAADSRKEIKLNDLEKKARYEIAIEDTGAATTVKGQLPVSIAIPNAPGSVIVFYRKI